MVITLTSALARDLVADLDGRAKVCWDDGQVDEGAAIDDALAWLRDMAVALRLLNGELEVALPAEHAAAIGAALDNLQALAAERRKRAN
jgi:hypothetical protein